MRRGYQTQWAGQFGVAHELVRRGYLVSFTSGNAPGDDLLCLSPSSIAFSVQVKSLSSKNYFFYQKNLREPKPTRFFAFVLVPADCSRAPEYFIMNNMQFQNLAEDERQRQQEQEKARPHVDVGPTISYFTVAKHDFRNAWGNLPK